jgi:hypothetical protein
MKRFPSPKQYQLALEAIGPTMSRGHRAMLEVLYQASDRALTTSQLATAAGYRGWPGACLQFGILSKRLCEALSFVPPQTYKDGSPIWSFVLAAAPEIATTKCWQWIMRPEAAQAIASLKWFDNSNRQRLLQIIHHRDLPMGG